MSVLQLTAVQCRNLAAELRQVAENKTFSDELQDCYRRVGASCDTMADSLELGDAMAIASRQERSPHP